MILDMSAQDARVHDADVGHTICTPLKLRHRRIFTAFEQCTMPARAAPAHPARSRCRRPPWPPCARSRGPGMAPAAVGACPSTPLCPPACSPCRGHSGAVEAESMATAGKALGRGDAARPGVQMPWQEENMENNTWVLLFPVFALQRGERARVPTKPLNARATGYPKSNLVHVAIRVRSHATLLACANKYGNSSGLEMNPSAFATARRRSSWCLKSIPSSSRHIRQSGESHERPRWAAGAPLGSLRSSGCLCIHPI